jgi:hypothetical protein
VPRRGARGCRPGDSARARRHGGAATAAATRRTAVGGGGAVITTGADGWSSSRRVASTCVPACTVPSYPAAAHAHRSHHTGTDFPIDHTSTQIAPHRRRRTQFPYYLTAGLGQRHRDCAAVPPARAHQQHGGRRRRIRRGGVAATAGARVGRALHDRQQRTTAGAGAGRPRGAARDRGALLARADPRAVPTAAGAAAGAGRWAAAAVGGAGRAHAGTLTRRRGSFPAPREH